MKRMEAKTKVISPKSWNARRLEKKKSERSKRTILITYSSHTKISLETGWLSPETSVCQAQKDRIGFC
jgi:hypothetical protein